MDKLIYALLSVKKKTERLHALLASMKGIAGADLYELSFGEITVIVSDINKTNLIADKSLAIEYGALIETLSQQFTLLPMRFGSLMESNEAIIQMLEKNYPEIEQNHLTVENKFEFGLKIFCEPEKIMAELIVKSEAECKGQLTPVTEIKNSASRNWVNKKLKEHRLEELLVTYVNSVIADVSEQLDRLKAIRKIKKMVTSTLIIDGVFLIDKLLKDDLIHAVGDLQNKYHGLNFIITGPWPPYNFVDFKVK
ncbi:MAG: GvpL/GvpF family gas vesicle protein [Bacteroidota bacterium]